MKCFMSLILFIVLSTPVFAGPKASPKVTVYKNSNGSIKFKSVDSGYKVRTYDSRGCFSGEFRKSGDSMIQTNKGFRSAKSGSSFGR